MMYIYESGDNRDRDRERDYEERGVSFLIIKAFTSTVLEEFEVMAAMFVTIGASTSFVPPTTVKFVLLVMMYSEFSSMP